MATEAKKEAAESDPEWVVASTMSPKNERRQVQMDEADAAAEKRAKDEAKAEKAEK